MTALAVMLAACGGDKRTGPETPTAPPASTTTTLSVARSTGVSGSLASGEYTGAVGRVVAYSFTAEPGYETPLVMLDSVLVPATGAVTVDRARALTAFALKSPAAAPPNEYSTSANAVFTTENPYVAQDAWRALLTAAVESALDGDSTKAARVRDAEYAALRAAGPEGLARQQSTLANTTFYLLGANPGEWPAATPASARLRPSGGAVIGGAASAAPPLFSPADTIVPTTYIYVNGIINLTYSSAATTASNLVGVLRESGLPTTAFLADPIASRPWAQARLLLHYNPTVASVPSTDPCLTAFKYAAAMVDYSERTASSMDAARYTATLMLQVGGQCALISTNLRVVEQYLTQLLGGPGVADFTDTRLTGLIDRERRATGGRNVVLVGHSQGTMISRTATSATTATGANTGCLGSLSIASPLPPSLAWPKADWRSHVIAKGERSGSWDLLFPLGGAGRTDGVATALTTALDQRVGLVETILLPYEQLQIHKMDAYLHPLNGMRRLIAQRLREGYGALGDACQGQLSGQVADITTQAPIAGATVRVRRATATRGTTTTGADGRFVTPKVDPTLYDLEITAPGYDTLVLSQRLVPFRSTAAAQAGPIYLGKGCGSSCTLAGQYTASYVLTGATNGVPLSCTFSSRVTLTQNGNALSGTITTDQVQTGCATAGSYVLWPPGVTQLTNGRLDGSTLSFTHDAVPPWQMTGTAYSTGFRVIEPAWRPSNGFQFRVELVASRTASAAGPLAPTVTPSLLSAGATGPRLGRWP